MLVRAVLSAKQKSVYAIMLVDTGSPYTFLTDETFKALGINLEEHQSDQAFLLLNAQRTKAHLSKAHFEEVNVLGTNFLDFVSCMSTIRRKAHGFLSFQYFLVEHGTSRGNNQAYLAPAKREAE